MARTFEDNIHLKDLVNGTKIIIKKVFCFLLEVYKPENEAKTFLIPRIIFKFTASKSSGIEILRRQFPIRLAYALTINKSQGQTLDIVGVDLREHVFSHGQLYVALSRARESKNICFLTKKSRHMLQILFLKNYCNVKMNTGGIDY